MGNFITVFIEVVYSVLQHPAEMPAFIKKIPGLQRQVMTALSLASLSSAAGSYYLRTHYASNFWFVLIILFIIHLALFLFWGLLFGSLTDAVVRLKYPDRSGQVWQMIAIAVFSCLPFMFALPLALIVRLAALNMSMEPFVLMTPCLFAILLWSAYITLAGLQYLYELTMRDAILTFLKAAAIAFLFPTLAVLFIFLELTQIFS